MLTAVFLDEKGVFLTYHSKGEWKVVESFILENYCSKINYDISVEICI